MKIFFRKILVNAYRIWIIVFKMELLVKIYDLYNDFLIENVF
jgi:hypothetical protein